MSSTTLRRELLIAERQKVGENERKLFNHGKHDIELGCVLHSTQIEDVFQNRWENCKYGSFVNYSDNYVVNRSAIENYQTIMCIDKKYYKIIFDNNCNQFESIHLITQIPISLNKHKNDIIIASYLTKNNKHLIVIYSRKTKDKNSCYMNVYNFITKQWFNSMNWIKHPTLPNIKSDLFSANNG